MTATELNLAQDHVHKLLCAASGDAALLYLYIQSGNTVEDAPQGLNMSSSRISGAAAMLRQLGLWPEKKVVSVPVGQRPQYSETDVLQAMEGSNSFPALYEEVQHLMGRSLNTEELKIILGFVRYLGLPGDVICLLVSYCKARSLERNGRNPSLRSIEKEAYAWAEQGIDSVEEAVAYMKNQKQRDSRMSRLMDQLQIRGRNLTAGEERYAQQWLDWGFDEEAIAMAYERTCLNTGGLSWAYMNKILSRWQEAGLQTAEQIRNGDRKPMPKGASGQLGNAELEAIQKLLREG